MERNRGENRGVFIEVMVVFSLLVALGFPGNYELVYGEKLGKLLEYAAFGVEILVILLSSADRWQDIQLLHLDKKYAVIYCYGVITFLMSMLATHYPAEQAITCARLLVTILFVIWLQEYYSLHQILDLMGIAQGLFVAAVLIFMLRHASLAYESGSTYQRALRGLYPSKNAFATELSFGILITALLLRQKQKSRQPAGRWLALLLIQGVLLLMCQATGAVLCVLISFVPLFFPDRVRLPLGLGYIVINGVFLLLTLTLMPLLQDFLAALGKDATLTGRIPLWNQIITVMTYNRPLIGYGYGMFWRDSGAVALVHAAFSVRKNSFMATMTTGAHNVILETWANCGLIGLALFFIALLRAFRDVSRLDRDAYRFCGVIMAYLTVNGLTERCLGGNYDFKTVALFLVMALCLHRTNDVNAPRFLRPAEETEGKDDHAIGLSASSEQ
ncbi:MAG: O-antigen ligase family protein [Clostridia bacterium]|nr:O-antigen ligase family protein [Clostridia bacterium]